MTDKLVTQLARDVQTHHTESAKGDVSKILARDVDKADQAGTSARLCRDLQELREAGMTTEQLTQLGFPVVSVGACAKSDQVVPKGADATKDILTGAERTERLNNYEDVAHFVCFHKGFGSGEERAAIEKFLLTEQSNGKSLDEICRTLNSQLTHIDPNGNWYFDGGNNPHLAKEVGINQIAFVHEREQNPSGIYGDRDQVVDKMELPKKSS